jgi:hypothetical protein
MLSDDYVRGWGLVCEPRDTPATTSAEMPGSWKPCIDKGGVYLDLCLRYQDGYIRLSYRLL